MRHFATAVALSCALIAIAAGWGWQRWLDTELSPTEYAALYAWRSISPDFFHEVILPDLEIAMSDGRLTRGELRTIEKRAGSAGKAFLEAARKPSFIESLQDAGEKAEQAGKGLSDSLSKALQDCLDFLQKKTEEFTDRLPQPREEPSHF